MALSFRRSIASGLVEGFGLLAYEGVAGHNAVYDFKTYACRKVVLHVLAHAGVGDEERNVMFGKEEWSSNAGEF